MNVKRDDKYHNSRFSTLSIDRSHIRPYGYVVYYVCIILGLYRLFHKIFNDVIVERTLHVFMWNNLLV